MKLLPVLILISALLLHREEAPLTHAKNNEDRVLVFTKTEGYRHGSISSGVSLIRKLGRAGNFEVDRTEKAEVFNPEDLEKYQLIIFLSTTGDVLNQEQQEAFMEYVKNGGSFMGIHAAADTEADWPWFVSLVGAGFESHPKVQKAVVTVADKGHPSTDFLPSSWTRTDEWYNFKNLKDDLHILLNLEESTYEGGTHGENHPVAWYQEYEGSRSFYTAGGHTDESYREPMFVAHIREGILWCLGRSTDKVSSN